MTEQTKEPKWMVKVYSAKLRTWIEYRFASKGEALLAMQDFVDQDIPERHMRGPLEEL